MNHEGPSPYSKLPAEHPVVAHYGPSFLARGGDHLVYEMAEHPGSVVKASTFKIRDILSYNAEHGLPLDTLPDQMEDWAGHMSSPNDEIAAKNSQIQML